MIQRSLSFFVSILMPAFVRLRLLNVLIVCALVLIVVRLERVYSISESVLVNAAKAEDKKADAPKESPDAPKPEEEKAKEESPKEEPKVQPIKSEFPKEVKSSEGFTAGSFDILELSSEQVEVLRTLSKRHRDLVQRERSIGEREATLQAIENRLDQKTEELKKIQDYLKELLGQKDEKEKEALKKLVIVYEKMKPGEAANILQGLDLETLLNIMDEMKDTKASAIMAKMEADKARVLTIELAQRRKKLEEKMKRQAEAEAEAEVEAEAEEPKLTPAAAPVAADPGELKEAAKAAGTQHEAEPTKKNTKPDDAEGKKPKDGPTPKDKSAAEKKA